MDLFNDCDELEYVDIVDMKQSAIIAIVYFGLIQIIKIIIDTAGIFLKLTNKMRHIKNSPHITSTFTSLATSAGVAPVTYAWPP